VIIFAALAAGIACRIELNPFRKGTRQGRRWPILAGIFTAPLIWVLAAYCDRRGIFAFPESATLRCIGVAAFAAGEIVRLAALHALGPQYSVFLTVQEGHRLIRTGIYRRIRHPFYLGGLINVPGVLLAFRSELSVLVLIASVLFVINRIRREEQLLCDAFPQAYPSYRQTSWRLLPYVY
jgi:protein-S-isoprenylcysteine O-methyltransferase Ste14